MTTTADEQMVHVYKITDTNVALSPIDSFIVPIETKRDEITKLIQAKPYYESSFRYGVLLPDRMNFVI